MDGTEHVAQDGTPQPRHVFAVFDSREQFDSASDALAGIGLQIERFEGPAADSLRQGEERSSVVSRFSRFMKGMMGGENHMAEVYKNYVDEGRVVMSAPAENPDRAVEITRIVTEHGGFDVTYFRDWAIQYMSPSENHERGVPSRSMTNTES